MQSSQSAMKVPFADMISSVSDVFQCKVVTSLDVEQITDMKRVV